MILPIPRPRGGHWPVGSHRRGTAYVLAAATVWGSLGVVGRIAFRTGVTPLEAAFFRAAISFIVLLGWMLATNRSALRIRPRDLGLFALFGLISIAAFFFVYLFAISQTSVAIAAILLYTAPAFVVVLSAVLFHEPVTRVKAGAVLLALVGSVLVVRGYRFESRHFTLPGVLAGLGAGVTYGLYSIFGKSALRRYGAMTILTYALGFGTLFLGIAVTLTRAVVWSHPTLGWGAILYLALVTTLLAQGLYLFGLRDLEAGRASLVATLEPVVAVGLAYVLLGEGVDVCQLVGGALILSAVVAVQWIPPSSGEAR